MFNCMSDVEKRNKIIPVLDDHFRPINTSYNGKNKTYTRVASVEPRKSEFHRNKEKTEMKHTNLFFP